MVSMGLFESWPTTVSNEATKLAFIMKSALRSLGSTLDSSAEHKAMKEPVRNKIQTSNCVIERNVPMNGISVCSTHRQTYLILKQHSTKCIKLRCMVAA